MIQLACSILALVDHVSALQVLDCSKEGKFYAG